MCENPLYFRGLGRGRPCLGGEFSGFRVRNPTFVTPVSARHFLISVFRCRRPVRQRTETGPRNVKLAIERQHAELAREQTDSL